MARNNLLMSSLYVASSQMGTGAAINAGSARPSLNTQVSRRRLLALLLDMIAFLSVQAMVQWLFGLTDWNEPLLLPHSTFSPLLGHLYSPWVLVIAFLYFFLFEALAGATPGKFLMGLRVVDVYGRYPALWRVVVRNVMRLIEVVPGIISFALLISGLYSLTSARHQRFGDRMAGTLVVDCACVPRFRSGRLQRLRRIACSAALAEAVCICCFGFMFFVQPLFYYQSWQRRVPPFLENRATSQHVGVPVRGQDHEGNVTMTYTFSHWEYSDNLDRRQFCDYHMVLRWENPVAGWLLDHQASGPASC